MNSHFLFAIIGQNCENIAQSVHIE